jgi:hypothetical protein
MLMMSDTSFGLILAYSLMIIGSIYMSNLTGASQMCKNLDSPHPLTPSPKDGIRGTRIMSPLSHIWERGWG